MIFAVDAVVSMACNILQLNPGLNGAMMYACLNGADAMLTVLSELKVQSLM